ncbi:MAG: sodium/solute symporter [Planctomycetes bacterium]|nr:sodium/solute symporter [Planctomycetota bacterium]
MQLTVLDILIFFAFIIGVILVGTLKSRHEKDSESYFLAGRGLKWWLIGFSLIAANISTEQFVGMSGSAANYLGMAIASYEWMAAITLVVVAFFFLPYFLKTGIFTMPEFLEHRYSPVARTFMAVFMLIILIGVSLSAVIYSGALTMSELFKDYSILGVEMDLRTCAWLIGIMAAIYVTSGGLKACAWADLIQGSALVIGGAVIMGFAFVKLGQTPVAELTTAGIVPPDLPDTASGVTKLLALNSDKLHMVLPRSDLNIPWTALVIGLWIPNFYYWGLNQYITQRVLGSASLSQGQKGIVFAAGLKLLIPFVIVIPGIIAFNLYAGDMAEKAANDPKIIAANEEALAEYEMIKASPGTPVVQPGEGEAPAEEFTVFPFDKGWAEYNPEKAKEIGAYNERVLAAAAAVKATPTEKALLGYKHDSALSLLIGKLIPSGLGLQGFVLAALLGAVVSSLAAMLNAASTIFTMDIFYKYIHPAATQKTLVGVGRTCVGLFTITGCLLAPLLDHPSFGGIFKYIQEFQGYISPGILAIFVFGLLNRRAPGITGVIGLVVNPFLYGGIAYFFPGVAFLDRMAICFFIVLIIMTAIGIAKPLPQPIEFQTKTKLDLRSSRPAMVWGVIVVIATVLLYIRFW